MAPRQQITPRRLSESATSPVRYKAQVMVEPAKLLSRIKSAASIRQWVETEVFRPVPWIFKGDAGLFEEWQQRIAAIADLDSNKVFLVGSASTGYSLSPYNPGRDFRKSGIRGMRPSDIDMAIVDERMFVDLWEVMLSLDRRFRLLQVLGQPGDLRGDELERTRRNVYWGTISHNCAPLGTHASRQFLQLFAATSRQKPFLGHSPKARVYRRQEDLLAYHEQSVKKLVRNLESQGY